MSAERVKASGLCQSKLGGIRFRDVSLFGTELVMEVCKCWSFLRPLCGREKRSGNRKLAGPVGVRDVDPPPPRRALLFPDPTHLVKTTPRIFHPSLLFQIPHLSERSPPPIWRCQAPHLRSRFSFLRSVPIHLTRQHPISLRRLGCRGGNGGTGPPGARCFPKHGRQLGSAARLSRQWLV